MSLENVVSEAKADLLDRIGTDDEVNAEGPEIRVDEDGYHYFWYNNIPKKEDDITETIRRCKIIARLERHNREVIIKWIKLTGQ